MCLLCVPMDGESRDSGAGSCLSVSCTAFAFWRRFTHDVDKKSRLPALPPPPRFQPGLQRLPRLLSAKWNQTAKTEQHNIKRASWESVVRGEGSWKWEEGSGERGVKACSILQHFVLISHFEKWQPPLERAFWCCPDAGSDVDVKTGSCFLASAGNQPMLHASCCMFYILSWYSAHQILYICCRVFKRL